MSATKASDPVRNQEENSPHDVAAGSMATRLLREPLLHFLLLGAGLFGLYAYLNADESSPADGEQIVVSAGKIEHLAALFARTWQRPPTREELEGLVDDFIREEAAYREGTALGLDRNDTIIRRRIRQKLDFVADDLASQLQPSDEVLQQYLEDCPEKFRVDSRISFRQVFFDRKRNGDDLADAVNDLVVRLREDSSIDARRLGHRTLLEFQYDNVSQQEVANLFGKQFADALVDLEPGTWGGPIASSYGVHAAIVDEITPGAIPNLEAIRDVVRREWEHERRQGLSKKFYEGLIDKYEVVVEWSQDKAN